MYISNLPYAYKSGHNCAGEKAYYYCHYCDLDLTGYECRYIAAGPIYANGEQAPCPRCGKENPINRDDDF